MSKESLYVPSSFDDQDWHLVIVGLLSLETPRARELSSRLLDWRIECHKYQRVWLEAFRELHK